MSFALSAWWHGFYPGYYFAFIYLGLANEAGKKVGDHSVCVCVCVIIAALFVCTFLPSVLCSFCVLVCL